MKFFAKLARQAVLFAGGVALFGLMAVAAMLCGFFAAAPFVGGESAVQQEMLIIAVWFSVGMAVIYGFKRHTDIQ